MKKALCLYLSLCLLLSLTACSAVRSGASAAESKPVQAADTVSSVVGGAARTSEPAQVSASETVQAAGEAAAPAATEETEAGKAAAGEKDPESDVMGILTQAKTTQHATGDPVDEEDLRTILEAGLNAPSAVNAQPWHFSVVTDQDLLQKIGDETLKVRTYKDLTKLNVWNAPVAVVISRTDNLATDAFDCGLACEAMSVAAQYLGYGTKIVAHPCLVLNGDDQAEYRDLLGIPEDHTAVALLLIGVPDESYDAVSSASTRNDFDEMVNFVK